MSSDLTQRRKGAKAQRSRMRICGLLLWLLAVVPLDASATGFTDIGQVIERAGEATIDVHGQLRSRSELLFNLDLDRGPTPSDQLLFPVPLSDPLGQMLTHFDLRLRGDIDLIAPDPGLALRLRLDILDNLELGSQPDAVPAVTTTQQPPEQPVQIRWAYGQALTPFGLFSVGRMGSHWGLGMLTNGGDCADCDSGDSADRFAFVTPILDHVWAVAFDISSTGPSIDRRSINRTVDLDPADNVRTFTFGMLNFRDELALRRRRLAQRATFEYGAYVSHRWQAQDVPASYLPTDEPVSLDSAQSMARGFSATAFDIWLQLTLENARLAAEAAVLLGTVDQPSLIPGVLLSEPLESLQYGFALESEFGALDAPFSAGLDMGLASGDPAPGFGVNVTSTSSLSEAGDLDGPQFVPGSDHEVDNFCFHADYRVDRILFREIIGTVTDAFYLRPHARWDLAQFGAGTLTASLVAITSWALESSSTPGGDSPLGLEIDPTLYWESTSGFSIAIEYAALFPFSGMDNPQAGLSAQVAQLLRFRLQFVY